MIRNKYTIHHHMMLKLLHPFQTLFHHINFFTLQNTIFQLPQIPEEGRILIFILLLFKFHPIYKTHTKTKNNHQTRHLSTLPQPTVSNPTVSTLMILFQNLQNFLMA